VSGAKAGLHLEPLRGNKMQPSLLQAGSIFLIQQSSIESKMDSSMIRACLSCMAVTNLDKRTNVRLTLDLLVR